MYRTCLLLLALAILPHSAAAQGLQDLFGNITIFIDNVLIPFLFGIAFLFFIINAVRFFVLRSGSEEGRENARNLLTYSVLAFVFLVIFWGIINLLSSSIGLEKYGPQVSDYMENNCQAIPNNGTCECDQEAPPDC